MKCKYCYDEFCVNSDSPYCADYCSINEHPEICKFSEELKETEVEKRNDKYSFKNM